LTSLSELMPEEEWEPVLDVKKRISSITEEYV
jgi:hypothetical protein